MNVKKTHRKNKWGRRQRRHMRIRTRVSGTTERPRLFVRKTLKHLYATVVDDSDPKGARTLLRVTTAKPGRDPKKAYRNVENAKQIGKEVGAALKEKGIDRVVFDRGGFRYHGCVKAIAEGVREAGITV
mgnify:FL=1